MAEGTGSPDPALPCTIKTRSKLRLFIVMAEGTGFEPAKALRPYTLSKRAP